MGMNDEEKKAWKGIIDDVVAANFLTLGWSLDEVDADAILAASIADGVRELAEENARLRARAEKAEEERDRLRASEEYLCRRKDEVDAVAEKHWQSYWQELGKTKSLEAEVERLREAVEIVNEYDGNLIDVLLRRRAGMEG